MPDDDFTTLDYRTPQAAGRRGIFSVPAVLASGAVAMIAAIDLLLIVPRFDVIFRDFGRPLPVLTQWLITASRLVSRGGWVALLVAPVVIGFLVALVTPARARPADSGPPERGRRILRMSLLLMITMFAIAIIVIVTVLALFLPMVSLIETVSGG